MKGLRSVLLTEKRKESLTESTRELCLGFELEVKKACVISLVGYLDRQSDCGLVGGISKEHQKV